MIIKDSIPSPLWKKIVKRGVKWTLSLTLILIVISFIILSGAATPLLNAYLEQVETAISQDLGEEFKVQQVKAQAFPWLVFKLESMRLGKLLEVNSLEVEINTLKALTTFGQTIEVSQATMSGVHLNVVRDKQGQWNILSLTQSSHQTQTTTAETDTIVHSADPLPSTAKSEIRALLNSLHLGEVHLKDVRITLDDQLDATASGPVTLVALDLDFPLLEPSRQIIVKLQGQVLGESQNFTSELHIGPYDEWLQDLTAQDKPLETETVVDHPLNPPFPLQLKVKATHLDLSLLSSLSPENAPFIEQAQSSGELEVTLEPAKLASIKGEWSVKGITTGQKGLSQRINLKIQPQLQVEIKKDQLKLSLGTTKLRVNQMEVELGGDVYQYTEALKLDHLKAQSSGITFGRILALVPQVRSSLPQGSKIEGPIELSIDTTGIDAEQSLNLRLSLDKAGINIPDSFIKTSTDPMRLGAKLKIAPTRINIRELKFILGDAQLLTQGQVTTSRKGRSVNAQSTLSEVTLAQLARFVPSIRESINTQGHKIEGQLRLESTLALQLKSVIPQINFEARLSIGGARLEADALKVIGSGGVIMRYKQSSDGDFSALFDSNLSSMDLKFGDAFVKPHGIVFDIELEAKKVGQRFDIPQFSIKLADLSLRGVGKHDASGFHLAAKLPPTRLTKVLNMFGATHQLGTDAKRGRLGFNLNIHGGAHPANDLTIDINNLQLSSPGNRIKVDLHVTSPLSPRVTFNLQSSKFDLDRLLPPPHDNTSQKNAITSRSSSTQSSSVETETETNTNRSPFVFEGKVNVKRGYARGVKFKDLSIQLSASENQVNLKKCTVKAMDGELNFHPLLLHLNPNPNKSTWSAELDIKQLNLAKAQSLIQNPSTLQGRLSGGFNLNGEGLDWERVSQSVSGHGQFKLKKGVIKGLGLKQKLLQATLGQLQKRIKSIKIGTAKKTDLRLKNISGAVKIKHGKINLLEGLKTSTVEGPIIFKGQIGLDGYIKLKSSLKLSAKRASQWFKTKITTPRSFPLDFTLSGQYSDPSLEGLAAASLIGAAAIAYGISRFAPDGVKEAMKQGRQQLEQVKQKAKRQVKKAVKNLKAKGESIKQDLEKKAATQINAVKERAEQEAKQAQAKAKKAAEKAKKEAQRQAERKANQVKNKLKGLF